MNNLIQAKILLSPIISMKINVSDLMDFLQNSITKFKCINKPLVKFMNKTLSTREIPKPWNLTVISLLSFALLIQPLTLKIMSTPSIESICTIQNEHIYIVCEQCGIDALLPRNTFAETYGN